MGEGELPDAETRGSGWFFTGIDPLAEKGELKPVLMPLGVDQGPRRIPPLGLEPTVRAVIPGKLVLPSRFSGAPARHFG